MTWLDIGNGWRNLFLLSSLLQMGALGCLFAARGWFVKKSRVACLLTGVASTPLVQYLWTLMLAAVWPHAPRLVYIGTLPALAALTLLVMGVLRLRCLKEKIRTGLQFLRRCLQLDKPALIALCFALCIVLLIGPVCVRFMSSMNSVGGGDAGEYMALGLHFCENRDLGYLLEKEETVGHFRGHSHFPSLELYMSYGLFHTGGEVGYPNDKAAFTAIGMLIFYVAAAYAALLAHFGREKKLCLCLGVLLFNLVPELYHSVAGAPRDIWRILAILWAVCVFAGITEEGNWKHYLPKLLLSFAVCFTVMSTHVVCFVTLPFVVVAWVIWRTVNAAMTKLRGTGKALVRSVGIALAGAAGTLAAFSGNIWCFLKWGEMSPWRLMTTYTDAPWFDMYMDLEYRLEETTTHLNFWQDADSIIQGYATPVGPMGMWLALGVLVLTMAVLIACRICMRRRANELIRSVRDQEGEGACAIGVIVNHNTGATETVSLMAFTAIITLLTLAPMSGVLDSPLYSFSGAFAKLPRYTLQWFLLANVTTCAVIAAVLEHWNGWMERLRLSDRAWLKTLPAWLCAALCLMLLMKGVNQTGYSKSFYRYTRDVVESEEILLDNGFRDQYAELMDVAQKVGEDQKILITRVGYQYALRGKAYVLTSNPIVPLLNLPLEEVGAELERLNVAMIATEPDFWDKRYYALSTLNEWLEQLPQEQVVESEKMRMYLLDPALVAAQE